MAKYTGYGFAVFAILHAIWAFGCSTVVWIFHQ
jgi:hypothetical protein